MNIHTLFALPVSIMLSVGLVCAQPSPTQYSEGTAIWRGFTQQTNATHKWVRVGNYIQFVNHTATGTLARHAHGSASQRKQDRAQVVSSYSFAQFNGGIAQEGEIVFEVKGKAKRDISGRTSLRLPVAQQDLNIRQYAVILNGYDLYANAKPAPISLFDIRLGSAGFDPIDSTVTFDASINLNFGKPGCLSNKVDYRLVVRYLIIGLHNNQGATRTTTIRRGIVWDKNNNPEITTPTTRLDASPNIEFTTATVGYSAFRMVLNAPHTQQMLNMELGVGDYDPRNGAVYIMPNFMFRQWGEMVKKRKAGAAEFQADIVVLQFREACIKQQRLEANIRLDGGGVPTEVEDAAYTSSTTIGIGCK